MIRIACPGCGSILNAKDELAGQTRKCPKCGGPVTIPTPPDWQTTSGSVSPKPPDAQPVAAANSAPTPMPAMEQQPTASPLPPRFERRNRYLVCDKTRVMAQWENNGQGWMFKTKAGLASVARHRDQLPNKGDFRLIEIKLEDTEAGYRLTQIVVYRLAAFDALLNLCRGDDAIFTSVVEPSSLNKAQKLSVWESLRQQLIPDVWERSAEAMKCLSSDDDS